MTNALLLSVHPEYVARILSGEKVFEFRKTVPTPMVTHLAIYATAPVKKIVAVAEVEGAVIGSKSGVWKSTCYGAGITNKHFNSYFTGIAQAKAYKLGSVFGIQSPVALSEINRKMVAPQSYRFLATDEFELIKKRMEAKPIYPREFIFLGGVHGVGKTFVCKQVFCPFGFTCATASELIKVAGGDVKPDKHVSSIEDNQKKLIDGLSAMRRQHAHFLVDGHFTLVSSQGSVKPIPVEVFCQISPTIFILMTGSPKEIAGRLKNRDSRQWSTTFIRSFQEQEVMHAHEIAATLQIPLVEVRNCEEVIDVVRGMRRLMKDDSPSDKCVPLA